MAQKYCITIPVYNEEKRIETGIRTLWNFLQENNIDARIDIADNGSIDSTKSIALGLSQQLAHVSYTQVSQKGVGLALQESWMKASEDYVGYMDVDLSTSLESFLRVKTLFDSDPSIDVVNGSRLINGSKVLGRTLTREITSRGFNFLLKFLLKSKISDGMCGFKFLKRTCFMQLREAGLQRHDWFFNTELLIRAEWAHLRVVEIPVIWQDDPTGSKVKIVSLAKSYLKSILELRKEHNVGRSRII